LVYGGMFQRRGVGERVFRGKDRGFMSRGEFLCRGCGCVLGVECLEVGDDALTCREAGLAEAADVEVIL
jgi:hypothetical protein